MRSILCHPVAEHDVAISTNKIQKEKKMQKTKKGLLMSLLWALVIITAVASSVAMTQSAKVATLHLEQTWTYDAPENVQVTFDANGGTFAINSSDTYTTTIKISTLSGTSIFPANPTKSGYTFAGWEYSVDGANYSDYASASDMPFTDHLYARAKWDAEPTKQKYDVSISFGSVQNSQFWVSTNVYDAEEEILLGSFDSPSGSINFNIPISEETLLYIEIEVADGHIGYREISSEQEYFPVDGDLYGFGSLVILVSSDIAILIDNCNFDYTE